MYNYRKYKFTPGMIYRTGYTKKYFKFIHSELVMESFVSYTFLICDESTRVAFHEDRDVMLKQFVEAEPAAQVLYGNKENTH